MTCRTSRLESNYKRSFMTLSNFHTILIYSVVLCEILRMCDCKHDDVTIMDITTPRNASLSAFYKRSFAYYSVKERLPKILTQTIDILVRNKEKIGEKYGPESREELKNVIGELSKLKYEVQTNKTMRVLFSDAPDIKFYNAYLAKQPNATYFTAIWLHTECYMYRRIREMFELTDHLKTYDPFFIQKQESYWSSVDSMVQLGDYLLPHLIDTNESLNVIKDQFLKLLKLNLWGNKCDLSFSGGQIEECSDQFDLLKKLEPNVLNDQSEEVWGAVSDLKNPSQIVDIVLDNAGYEVFTDLCIADFLISKGLARNVRIYVKSIPWFVSDVMIADFDWLLEQLRNHKDENMVVLGKRWSDYVKGSVWTLVDDNFFTLPVDYTYMAKEAPRLYRQLAQAKVAIFKGDLNYRKLIGERNWAPTTPCDVAFQGFGPTKIVALRTVKCHAICGLKEGVAEAVEEKDPDWMNTGNYGVIQYCDKIVEM